MLRGMMRRATRYHCANTRTVVTAHPTAPATACHWSAVVRHHTRGRSTHRQKQPHKRAVADWLLGGRSVAADGDDAAELRQHLPSAGDEIDGAAASTASAVEAAMAAAVIAAAVTAAAAAATTSNATAPLENKEPKPPRRAARRSGSTLAARWPLSCLVLSTTPMVLLVLLLMCSTLVAPDKLAKKCQSWHETFQILE